MLKLSLKTKFTVMIALQVSLALVAMALATYVPLRHALSDQQQTFLGLVDAAKTNRMNGVLGYVTGYLQSWGGSDVLRGAATQGDKDGAVSRYLRDQQTINAHFVAKIFLVDVNGQILGASDRSLVGRRLSDFWHGGQIAGKYTLGPTSTLGALPFAEQPTLAQAAPYELPNGSQGALVAYLNWQGIVEHYMGLHTAEAGRSDDDDMLILLNGQGNVLGVSNQLDPAHLFIPGHAAETLADLHLTVEGGTIPTGPKSFAVEMHGHMYQALTLSLGHDIGWQMVFARGQEASEGYLASLRGYIVLGGLLAIIISFLIAYRMGSRLSGALMGLLPAFERLAAGDLDCQVTCNTGDEVEHIARQFNLVVAKLREIVKNIVDSTHTLSESATLLADLGQNLVNNAQETSSQAGAASKISDEVSTNINTVSAGVEEMSLSINEIARSSDEAARVATSAVRIAEMTNTTVAELGGSSSEIGNVIKVINSIAEQTNLLALNATIEAARAGEAGKGFAVVANEVKELAKETARATEDIGKKIEAIQAKTKGAVGAIAEIGTIINRVNDYQTTIASAVQEQLATTTEIGRNVAEVAERSYMITKNISAVAQIADSASTGANETRNATAEVARISADLQEIVRSFRYTRQ